MAWKFWLVGATWEGEDLTEEFYKKGIWRIGYGENDVPNYDERLQRISDRDRIAIKSMNGKGATDITIKAFGIVKGVDIDTRTVYVDWVLTGLNRKVDSRGCFGTIHGPYTKDNWIRRIFSL